MQLYNDRVYAAERLNGTVVRAGDKAVRVIAIGAATAVQYLSNGIAENIPYNKLNLDPVPLGYCNFGGSAVYLSRSPVREDWKQGLRPGTMRATFLERPKALVVEEDDDQPRFGDVGPPLRLKNIPDVELAKTIEGVFPTFDEVISALRRGGRKLVSLAYSRNFAIDTEYNIFHKGEYLIGKFTSPETRTYQLNDKFWWAKEALEESF